MKKALAFSLLFIVSCFFTVGPAQAVTEPAPDQKHPEPAIYDYGHVFTDSEEERLLQSFYNAWHMYGIVTVLETETTMPSSIHLASYAPERANKLAIGNGEENNGLYLILDKGNNRYYMAPADGVSQWVTPQQFDEIASKVARPQFQKDRYYEGVLNSLGTAAYTYANKGTYPDSMTSNKPVNLEEALWGLAGMGLLGCVAYGGVLTVRGIKKKELARVDVAVTEALKNSNHINGLKTRGERARYLRNFARRHQIKNEEEFFTKVETRLLESTNKKYAKNFVLAANESINEANERLKAEEEKINEFMESLTPKELEALQTVTTAKEKELLIDRYQKERGISITDLILWTYIYHTFTHDLGSFAGDHAAQKQWESTRYSNSNNSNSSSSWRGISSGSSSWGSSGGSSFSRGRGGGTSW